MTRPARLLLLALLGSAAPLAAEPLALDAPGAVTAQRHEGPARVALPVGVWREGAVPMAAAEGAVRLEARRLEGGGRTPLQILAPLRAQLDAAGFEVIFECADLECGGFDFRYSLELLPEPAMHVDLGEFHWLTARRAPDDTGQAGAAEHVGLIASRSAASGYLHLTHVGPDVGAADPALTLSSRNARDPFLEELTGAGSATLEDLSFATGAASLAGDGPASLEVLADWLGANPEQRVTLLGHTDSRGALDRNIALSEARAAAVRERLVQGLGVDPSQVAVRGLGPEQPRASNDTAEGRRLNRRVEVVLE
jgi:OOP family OmpA-OmpF porin